MNQRELSPVTEDEARKSLTDILHHSPTRAIQHLRGKTQTGGIHGRRHGCCIVGSIAEGMGHGVNENNPSDVVRIRSIRQMIGVSPDPSDLIAIEVYCLNVVPTDTIENSPELRLVAEVVDQVLREPRMRNGRLLTHA